VAGVTTLQIREELVRLMHDRALRSLSQALGVALAEWSVWRGEGVLHPGEPPSVHPYRGRGESGSKPRDGGWTMTSDAPHAKFVSIRPLKDLVLARFPEGHPLREVILAERDTLSSNELVAKVETWVFLFNRRS